jgi:hypothetical protein
MVIRASALVWARYVAVSAPRVGVVSRAVRVASVSPSTAPEKGVEVGARED